MEFLDILTLAAALGSGLVAGIFFAFSNFVMRAFRQLPDEAGMAAMQAINVTVLNPWFLLTFLGTGAGCLPLAFLAVGGTFATQRAYLLMACALYLFGTLLVTGTLNVPLNDRLAAAKPGTASAETLWRHYLARWSFWNHVRTVASLGASGLFAMALRSGAVGQ